MNQTRLTILCSRSQPLWRKTQTSTCWVSPSCSGQENAVGSYCPSCAYSIQPLTQSCIFRCCVHDQISFFVVNAKIYLAPTSVCVRVYKWLLILSLSDEDQLASSSSQPESCTTLTSGACVGFQIVQGQKEASKT